ncbi:Zn-ribbon domain-containing OB-fold protein [Sporichthya sp.]|uniref:Zn-ribbon domain-containing OB-fold protein n=1 Tax=Sporichthya sp. TaxID=65475 RepID=UPI001846FE51|nr:OB-fold nucleic acid binding domain-containing protein [Sporichthya sp.]MBA3743576.1 OB-fold domain-containing protein [Sporichthya sp.]
MGLLVDYDEPQMMAATLTMPYTLTTGPAAGTFLAELANNRIVGTRIVSTGRVIVPPEDYPGGMSDVETEFVEVPQTGAVTTFTRTVNGVVALIRLDGADTDLLHRVVGDTAGLAAGDRVAASWHTGSVDELASPFLQLAGFAATADGTTGEVTPLSGPAEAIAELPYSMKLDYEHSYGPYYGRMFDELASARRIVGSKCPKCLNVLVPARGNCDACFVPTGQLMDVADTGTILGFSVIHLEFLGQKRKPPYVYAEINLDGTATRLIHNVGGFDITKAEELLDIGSRVRAVWKDVSPGSGTLDDIEYFEPIDLPSSGA